MSRPAIPGLCPFYNQSSGTCYLAETTPASGTREQKCKSSSNCKTCGNYEAWSSGKRYQGK